MPTTSNPRILFLMDGLGAACSCFLLSVILSGYPDFFGVSSDVAIILSLLAAVLSVCTFICYFFSKKQPHLLITLMGFGNLIYCILTIVMLVQMPEKIKWPGVIYFTGELSILGLLIRAEWKAGRSAR